MLEVMVSGMVIARAECPMNILYFRIIGLCFAYNIH